MYRHNTRSRSNKHLRIKLDPMPVDPRLSFVDRVCHLMINGRFGSNRMCRLMAHVPERAGIAAAFFVDLDEIGPAPLDYIGEEMDRYPSLAATHPGIRAASRLFIRNTVMTNGGRLPKPGSLVRGRSP